MNKFIAILFLMLSMPVMADRIIIDVNGKLTDQQKAELNLAAQQKSLDAQKTTLTPETKIDDIMNTGAKIGAAVASGMVTAAKEVGSTVNEFAQTPVGKMTALVVIWHYIGQDLAHMVFGFLWLITLTPIWIWMYRSRFFVKTVTYYETGKGPNGEKKMVVKTPVSHSDKEYSDFPTNAFHSFMYLIALGVIIVVGIVFV